MERVLKVRRPPEQSQTGLSRASKIFFGCDIFQVVAVVVFQSTMIALGDFSAYNDERPGMGPGRRIYMVVYMAAVVYTCFLCLFAVKKQNFMEIVAFDLQNFGFVTYSGIQLYHVGFKRYKGLLTSGNTILPKIVLANAVTVLLLNILFTYLSYKLYMEFGWKIYKRVRFNIKLRGIYQVYELLSCLLKMEILYWGMFAICHSLVLLRDSHTFLYRLNLAFIPLSLAYAGLAYYATRHENKVLMLLFLSWTLAGAGYFLYKLYGFITRTCNGCSEFEVTGKDIPDEAFMHFVYLGSINLLVIMTIFGVALKAFLNFGGGLAEHFNSRLPTTKATATQHLSLGRVSHYAEESVISVTSYDSVFDELGQSVRLDRGVIPSAYSSALHAAAVPLLTNKRLNQIILEEEKSSSLPDLRADSPPRPTSFPGHSNGELSLFSGWLRTTRDGTSPTGVTLEITSEDAVARGATNVICDNENVIRNHIPTKAEAETQVTDPSVISNNALLQNGSVDKPCSKCCEVSSFSQNGENGNHCSRTPLMQPVLEESCGNGSLKTNCGSDPASSCECHQKVSVSNGKLSIHTSNFSPKDKALEDFSVGQDQVSDRLSVV